MPAYMKQAFFIYGYYFIRAFLPLIMYIPLGIINVRFCSHIHL